MPPLDHVGCVVLYCVLYLVMPTLLHGELTLAYVTKYNLLICQCAQDLPVCSIINSNHPSCICNRPLSTPQRQVHSPAVLQYSHLTVWYSSPLNTARLLNNSEVRNLTLIKCNLSEDEPPAFDHFAVQRLERLRVLYPVWRPGQSHDMLLGRDMGAPYHEEARIAIIHAAVLAGAHELKAYTVKTEVDSQGKMSLPHIFMSNDNLTEMTSMFVTFVY
ncbi:hypothetical protein AMEX_G9533 [Astyanax mexicanus]|uniref:Uncharacterized protein n=1 Tax=Astyanax mexicanus TaxID=7994 RepID=A0A8T2LW77_ASTMX|nr:hypothetical protein AMEX_G9533 [Astyanax mexicanus]